MKRYIADVLVPAYNEEAMIGKTLRSIANQKIEPDWHFRVQVITNGCTDDTRKVAERTIAELQHNEHFEFVLHSLEQPSKIRALQFGLDRADAPLIFCIDADSIVSNNCFAATLREFQNPHTMLAGPLPQVIVPKERCNTKLGYIHRTANVCRRAYEVISPGGAMIGYRRENMDGYPEGIASDDSYVTFKMAERFGWESVRVPRDAVVYWIGAQNWVDYIKQESRFARATVQLLERFPEFATVRQTQKEIVRWEERKKLVTVRFKLKRAGIPLGTLGYLRFLQKACAENAGFIPDQLIGSDGRWETILSTKQAPDCDPALPC
ncbi:MAG TPA: glycosyltransferase family 2 protein [Patescibacteria group bacterium]|nr:glycosyltransferase family 2 protein [Patescibacteria group bacterium]